MVWNAKVIWYETIFFTKLVFMMAEFEASIFNTFLNFQIKHKYNEREKFPSKHNVTSEYKILRMGSVGHVLHYGFSIAFQIPIAVNTCLIFSDEKSGNMKIFPMYIVKGICCCILSQLTHAIGFCISYLVVNWNVNRLQDSNNKMLRGRITVVKNHVVGFHFGYFLPKDYTS